MSVGKSEKTLQRTQKNKSRLSEEKGFAQQKSSKVGMI
jgi:hypothetical protein